LVTAGDFKSGFGLIGSGRFDIAFFGEKIGLEHGIDLISDAGGRLCPKPMVLLASKFDSGREEHYLRAGAVDIIDNGELSPALLRRVIRYARFNHDTTQRLIVNEQRYCELAENASQPSGERSKLLVHMSHELRTPLNVILGFSEILKEQFLGPHEGDAATRYNGYAGDIYISSQHLLGLINDLLDLSKFEARETEAVMSATSIDELLEDLVMITATEASNAGVGVTVQIPAGVEDPVIYRRLILQTLVNVTTNAIKFSDAGATVYISVEAQGAGLVLKISDTGIGIAEKDLETVMLPYCQGNAMKTRPGGGTGLGLALTSAIMELHQGDLTIDRKVGAGTVVTMHLPYQVSVL